MRNPGPATISGGIGINVSDSGSVVFQVNRAERRRLKRALKLPFTPTAEFTAQYLEKMSAERNAKAAEPVKVRVPRAWANDDSTSEA